MRRRDVIEDLHKLISVICGSDNERAEKMAAAPNAGSKFLYFLQLLLLLQGEYLGADINIADINKFVIETCKGDGLEYPGGTGKTPERMGDV